MTQRCVFLHIGNGRCGSSAIQDLGTERRAELAAMGLCYPTPAELGFPQFPDEGGNAGVIRALKASRREVVGTIADRLAAHGADRFLLSSEYLINFKPGFLKYAAQELRERGFRVVALAYVREQRQWLLSRYAHAVWRGRTDETAEAFLASSYQRRLLDYLPVFAPLRDAFGPDDLVVRVYARDRLRAGDVRADAFAVAGLDVRALLDTATRANESTPLETIQALRAVYAQLGAGAFVPLELLEVARAVRDEAGWPASPPLYRTVPPPLMREIRDHYAGPNEAFRQAFFPAEPAPLLPAAIPDDYAVLPQDAVVADRAREIVDRFMALRRASPDSTATRRRRRP